MIHSHEASTKVCVFVNTQPVFIGLTHRPTSIMTVRGKSSCMSGYSYLTSRLCHNTTVTVADRSGLSDHVCMCI